MTRVAVANAVLLLSLHSAALDLSTDLRLSSFYWSLTPYVPKLATARCDRWSSFCWITFRKTQREVEIYTATAMRIPKKLC
ncbi:unnamed protein product [Acanthoscelides obtectus]|uniref:Secreted protein n=1 Tax=Acanthoscelides obtectus TaxID=200917 RepID=A0A9P0MIK6_ACAOB|nr:unnamed protein product [Acanthoscelides obtectus]CAK1659865.1 hypothetical protein AOBTE_LOCUS21718 [Acanthoscelides obtectus]